MRNTNTLTEHRLRIDVELLEKLQQLGVIETQYDMSRLCGMNESYCSSMKSKGYGMTIGSLVYLCCILSHRSQQADDHRVAAVLHRAVELVQRAIAQKCRIREIEVQQMKEKKRCE